MANLMIVDDEETTRESLKDLVPWADWGIRDVRAAENGLAALALAETFPPAILLTDIRMPRMNGIELARQIRERCPACEIVFLSGFSDKEYLKSAIQLHAVDYLDKPVDLEALRTLIEGIVSRIEAADRRKGEVHYRRQDAVLELIGRGTGLPELAGRLDPDVLRLRTGMRYLVLAAQLNWSASVESGEKAILKHELLVRLGETERLGGLAFISGFLEDDALAMIACADASLPAATVAGTAAEALGRIRSATEGACSLTVGVAPPFADEGGFGSRYKEARDTAKRQFYLGTGQVIVADRAREPGSYPIDKGELARFKKLLREESPEEVAAYVGRTTRDIAAAGDPDTNKIRNLYFNYMRVLFETTMKWDLTESESEAGYLWREIDTRVTLGELSELLLDNVDAVMRKPAGKEHGTDKLDEVLKYVGAHYTSNQLTIQSIADRTLLSLTYLCAFFKKSTGRTLNDYITGLRIEKAKALLQDRNMKLSEIAAAIGLTDPNYFSTLFKKYAGLTPSEYRVKHYYDQSR
ncbi:response regulator [Cohnella sp. GCM10027633]|uniref:response regulator transcription factor n=1 Tax=unclassified Cohnella TaxID=2636738 RepID=UPI00362C7126